MRVFIATLLLAGVGASAAEAPSPGTTLATVDPASRIEFALTTFWGQTLIGRFPQSTGEVVALPDGRRQVRLLLPTTDVEIADHPRYTRFAQRAGASTNCSGRWMPCMRRRPFSTPPSCSNCTV